MKKIALIFTFALLMTGCANQPQPNITTGKVKTSTLSGNDVTALGIKFDSMLKLQFGDTYSMTNSDGTVTVSRFIK